jgi:hypothetical protein
MGEIWVLYLLRGSVALSSDQMIPGFSFAVYQGGKFALNEGHLYLSGVLV